MSLSAVSFLTLCGLALVSIALARPTGRILEKAGQSSTLLHRERRKIGNYSGPGPLEYMMGLKDRLKKRGSSQDVWLLMDSDVFNNNLKNKIQSSQCSRSHNFTFSLSSFAKTHAEEHYNISSTVFRAYMQVKNHLRPIGNETVTVDATVTLSVTGNFSNSTIIGHTTRFNIDSSSKDQWVEWNITNALLQNCWMLKEGFEHMQLQVKFAMPFCTSSKQLVPVSIVDPGTIALNSKRRNKFSVFQPMIVVYMFGDEDGTANIKDSSNLPVQVSNTAAQVNSTQAPPSDSSSSRQKRQTVTRTVGSDTGNCRVANYTINFADLGLHNILAPFAYNARHCVGLCTPHRIERTLDKTNHARLFSTAYALYVHQPSKFSSAPMNPCCVPVEYTFIHLLELRKDGALSYMKYPDMMVNRCGCR